MGVCRFLILPFFRILSVLGAGFYAGVVVAAPVDYPEEEFVFARQDFGETRADKAVSGNPLSIAGKTYKRGIGTHATSMIPIDVPETVARFSGGVGLDDGASGGDGVEFRILSGSSVLWSSGVMQHGMVEKKFKIDIPAGVKKIYLLTVARENQTSDHADWVNLNWENGRRRGAEGNADTFLGHKFGILANVEKDQTEAFHKALTALRSRSGSTLELKKGTYHFYPEFAQEMSFWISNHDQQEKHQIMIPLVDLHNVTIRGNGSTFVFHGKCLPILFMDSENVTLEGVRVDFARPIYSEAKVLEFKDGKTIVSIDEKAFPYEVRNERLVFIGENYPPQGIQTVIAFREKTKNIVSNTSDIYCGNGATALNRGKIALHRDFSKDGDGIVPGDTLVLRSWWRPAPACVIYRAKNTTLRDVSIHSSFGMTLLAQRSENITLVGTKKAEAKTSGIFPRPETGRVYSASADATHFSNVKGLVTIENSFFETMMDDAINVHSTCLDIAEIVSPNTIRCRYKHGQAIGFELFFSEETLRFIAGTTLENGALVKVKNAKRISPTEVVIQLAENIPAGVRLGDAVENADFQPAVIFRGNIVQNNRARGALFTTPRKVLVENNVFQNVAGAAILLAGDAQGWYESGACEDVVIRKNLFVNNLTSRFQFTNAIISIYPEVRKLGEQSKYYHHNILIAENEFRTFDVPLLFAISTEKIHFEKNKIYWNNDFKPWRQKPFQFLRCANIVIRENDEVPLGEKALKSQKWTLNDCRLEMTPAKEVRFN